VLAFQFNAWRTIDEVVAAKVESNGFIYDQLVVYDVKSMTQDLTNKTVKGEGEPAMIYSKQSPSQSELPIHLNLTYQGLKLALGDPLGDESHTPVGELTSSPNVFIEVIHDNELYISRVFSPSNATGNVSAPLGSRYDFMVAISGPSVMNEELRSELRSKIKIEFNQFSVYTIVPALFIIMVVSAGLIWYAKSKISDRINQLTLMVDNPH